MAYQYRDHKMSIVAHWAEKKGKLPDLSKAVRDGTITKLDIGMIDECFNLQLAFDRTSLPIAVKLRKILDLKSINDLSSPLVETL